MAWKEWPLWLRGGVLGLIIPIIGTILFFLTSGSDMVILVSILFLFGEGMPEGVLLSISVWFVIGALLGYAIQHFKK